jgi:GAF domain-containing protein
MYELSQECPFRCALSLKPLIDFWRRTYAPSDACTEALRGEIEKQLARAPELLNPIEDPAILKPHEDLVRILMSTVFPVAFWETDVVGAMVPFTLKPFLVSPRFQSLLLNEDGSFRGSLHVEPDVFRRARLARLYLQILRQCYGLEKGLDYPFTRVVEDPETGLNRYFRLSVDCRFVQVEPTSRVKNLSDRDLAEILEHLTEPEILEEFLPSDNFSFHGFVVINAVDVTHSEIISALQKDLIGEGYMFSKHGFSRLQQRLRTLFCNPELSAGLAAIRDDQVLMLSTGCEMDCNCFFSDSRHLPVTEFAGSVLQRAVDTKGTLRIRDLMETPFRTRIEEEFLAGGIRSLIITPLYDQGELIGILNLGAPISSPLGPTDEILVDHILPVFSIAVKRSLSEFDNRVQSIIKEKCTAVHPSVEWRFRQSVLRHLERVAKGVTSDLEPIVFRDVYPLYAAADIRGSSEVRNKAIQADLIEHLNLGLRVVTAPGARIPILQELTYRISQQMELLEKGLGSGVEKSVLDLLHREVEPLFSFVCDLGPEAISAVEKYKESIDAHLGTVYHERKEFEECVALFNERVASYLDREEAEAQAMFPHYFDKHQTDGVSYVIYIGASMVENGAFNDLYVRNLRLWQLMVSCGIAWQTEQIKSSFRNPFDTTHLILVHHSPLSIRFRFDEKRFDVDGAYDIGHEIIRSRIDKATIKGGDQRLTQPGKIAIVYSRPEEETEMLGYITFLRNKEFLCDDIERVELEDLPGVQGLRALRVGVKLDSTAIEARVEQMMSGS